MSLAERASSWSMEYDGAVASIFGTDGIRDRAGEGLLRPESVRLVARAVASVLAGRGEFAGDVPPDRGRLIAIGRDTRGSGPRLLEEVSAELLEQGFDVADLGILPTPGVAFMARALPECALAIVLSASHNPASDNGIKLLSARGTKVSQRFEEAVSEVYHRLARGDLPGGNGASRPGVFREHSVQAFERYVEFLAGSCERPARLRGKRVALDTAHGAAYRTAGEVFRRLGMDVVSIGERPDGSNINDGCGALHPERLARRVREVSARVGFSFDGDADRMVPVTSAGAILDGDFVLALAARAYAREGRLPARTVVGTVMSNIGLEQCLAGMGLRLERTPVGDRHVYQAMVAGGHPIGGEQSGHLIFRDRAETGDGVLAALRLLDVLDGDDLDLEGESRIMIRLPQVLRNVRVRERVPLLSVPEVARAVTRAEERLGGRGRVLLRYSGTEPLARVMLEGPEQDLIDELTSQICRAIEDRLGA